MKKIQPPSPIRHTYEAPVLLLPYWKIVRRAEHGFPPQSQNLRPHSKDHAEHVHGFQPLLQKTVEKVFRIEMFLLFLPGVGGSSPAGRPPQRELQSILHRERLEEGKIHGFRVAIRIRRPAHFADCGVQDRRAGVSVGNSERGDPGRTAERDKTFQFVTILSSFYQLLQSAGTYLLQGLGHNHTVNGARPYP